MFIYDKTIFHYSRETMEKETKSVMVISILIFLTTIGISITNEVYGFIPDAIIFSLMIIFFAFTYETFRLNTPILTMITIGLLLHMCGIFGWYHTSPLPIQWAHITHFFGTLPFACMFYRFLDQWSDMKLFTKKNLAIIIAVFLCATGAGAIVELSEFAGYLTLGYGEGALMFGDGDGTQGLTGDALIQTIGGGWINMGWDLIFNTLGIITGIGIMLMGKIIYKKPEKAYYYETLGEYSKKI